MLNKKELEILEMIRESDNPQMALYIALGIISDVTKKQQQP